MRGGKKLKIGVGYSPFGGRRSTIAVGLIALREIELRYLF